jgi:hypothetical protein
MNKQFSRPFSSEMNMSNKNPKWLDNAIFYEIYPQSFYDSNGAVILME